jgi:hypothetical protein
MIGSLSLEIEPQIRSVTPGGMGESFDLRKFQPETVKKAGNYIGALGLDPLQENSLVHSYCLIREDSWSGDICDQKVFALALLHTGKSGEYFVFTGRYPNIFK